METTALQRQFCVEYALDGVGCKALQRAHAVLNRPAVSDEVAAVDATRMLGYANVKTELKRLTEAKNELKYLQLAARMEFLAEAMADPLVKMEHKLRANELLTKIKGEFAPTKVDVDDQRQGFRELMLEIRGEPAIGVEGERGDD